MDLKLNENLKEYSDEEESLVFHYDRNARIQNAPKIVQDYYNGEIKAFKPGIFKALVSTKQNKFVLIVLLICFAVVLFQGLFNKQNKETFFNTDIELSAFSFEENIYVSLSFEKTKKFSGIQNFTVEIEFLDNTKNVVHKTNETYIFNGENSFLRTTFYDYDIVYVRAKLIFEKKECVLETEVQKH